MTAIIDRQWREINTEFGQQEIVPENEKELGHFYQNMEFDFDEIDQTITLRGRAKISQSTGLALWTCSQILSSFLVENPHYVQKQRVLELGSGLGLCSILSHILGASQVLATDGDFDVLDNLRHNAEQNRKLGGEKEESGIISCPQLIWGEGLTEFKVLHAKQSVILATDVFYSEHLVDPLWKTIDSLLEDDGVFLLGFCPHSVAMNQVLETAREYGFSWTIPNICEGGESKEEEDDDHVDSDDFFSNTASFGYHVCIFKREH